MARRGHPGIVPSVTAGWGGGSPVPLFRFSELCLTATGALRSLALSNAGAASSRTAFCQVQITLGWIL